MDLSVPLKQRMKTDILARPRLVIEHMRLENFKSYAGVQEIGPFDKCFTAVVGPNGSGKSNVLDALLFVFGKRAKRIRLKKVGELVHRSAAHPNIQQASVTVFFHEVVEDPAAGPGATRVVPGSEMTLTRTANRNDTSRYYVNGRASNFTEVTEILGRKGVDLEHNRFLILQGEVEQIAMMPPKAANKNEEGMLEYLEDIIGTDRFIELIDKAAADLDQVQEQRTEQLNRVKLVVRERQSLEAAKLEAEEFLHLDQQIIRKKTLVAQKQVAAAAAATRTLTERSTLLAEKLRAEQERQSESNRRLAELEGAIRTATAAYEGVSKELAATKAQLDAFQRQDVQLGEDDKHCRAQQQKLEKLLAREQEKARRLDAQVAEKQEERRDITARIAALQEQLTAEQAALAALYESLKGETGQLQAEMDRKQAELLPSQTRQQELRAQESVHSGELALIRGADAAKQREVAQLEADVAALDAREQQQQAELARVAETLRSQAARLDACRRAAAECAREEERVGAELRAVGARVAERRAALEAARSRGAVVEAIMQLKASGRVPGIFGRLGDLGRIDPRYDVAVTTACHALDNIVVQSADTGQACLEHLRATRAGRGTFIILDEVARLPWVQRGSTAAYTPPAGAQRLFDLVTLAHERFRPALYWALGDTLVADRADMATTIAFRSGPRRRVVTLDGQLMEPSGTMSGGGQRVLRGGMKTTGGGNSGSTNSGNGNNSGDNDDDDNTPLEALEKRLAELREEYERVQRARAGHEREAAQLEGMSTTTSAKLEMDIAETRAQRADVARRLADARARPAVTRAQEARAAELERLVAAGRAEVAALHAASAQLEAEIAALKEQIMQAGGTRLREQKQRVAALADEIAAAEKAATKCDVDAGSAEKAAAKSRAAAAKAEADLADVRARLARLEEESRALEDKAGAVMAAFEQAQAALAAQQAALDAKQAELAAHREERAKAANVEAELRDALDDCRKQLADRAHVTKVYTAQLHELRGEWQNVLVLLAGGKEEYERDQASMKDDGDDHEHQDEEKEKKDKEEKEEEEEDDPFKDKSEEELDKYDIDDLKVEMSACEEHKSKLSPNMNAIGDYRAKEREYQGRMRELEQTTRVRDELRQRCEDLRRQRLVEFTEGFEQITLKLKEMYRMITVGGDAELELVDRLNPFSEGVVFSVRPAKKTWKNISNLSGGEKTLSSLALVFALHHFKPTPIYVMDEIDAALDFRNVSIVANYIKECTRGAQFIVISLRNYMFELADRLVGIFKIADCTGSIAICPAQYASALATSPPKHEEQQHQGQQQEHQDKAVVSKT